MTLKPRGYPPSFVIGRWQQEQPRLNSVESLQHMERYTRMLVIKWGQFKITCQVQTVPALLHFSLEDALSYYSHCESQASCFRFWVSGMLGAGGNPSLWRAQRECITTCILKHSSSAFFWPTCSPLGFDDGTCIQLALIHILASPGRTVASLLKSETHGT